MGLEYFRPSLRSHDLVQDLKWDLHLLEDFERDEQSVLDRYDLSVAERDAIARRDFRALYELGLHPYLLAQLARLVYGTAERAGTSVAASALMRSLLGPDADARFDRRAEPRP